MKNSVNIAGLKVNFATAHFDMGEGAFDNYLIPFTPNPDLEIDPSGWIDRIELETGQDDALAEFYALSTALGEELPLFNRIQTHGVAISYEGKSYVFSAPSGEGKSTRAFIWQKYLGADKVEIINGDKPIIWFQDNDVIACGSPWPGKERLQKNVCVPLGGLCLLHRSPANTIRKAEPQEFFDLFIKQVQLPGKAQSLVKALSLIEELYKRTRVFILENDMSEQGMKICYEALTGKNFEENKIV